MMAVGVAAFMLIGIAGLVGMLISALTMARLGQALPDRPLHTRLNPFNHMGRPQTWTPEMRAANRRGVVSGFVFLASALAVAGLVILFGPGR
jgi:hypothetical protein